MNANTAASPFARDALCRALAEAGAALLPPELLGCLRAGDIAIDVPLGTPPHCHVLESSWSPAGWQSRSIDGRAAALQALAGIDARGAHPVLALPLMGGLRSAARYERWSAMAAVCRETGVAFAESLVLETETEGCGLAVIGRATPQHVKGAHGARPGDFLVLSRPLGGAFHQRAEADHSLRPGERDSLLAELTIADSAGPLLACLDGVHAMMAPGATGLAGALAGLCRSNGVQAILRGADLPLLPGVQEMAGRYADVDGTVLPEEILLAGECEKLVRMVLNAPQLTGGTLVSCSEETLTEVLSIFLQRGFEHVSVIGRLSGGEAPADGR